MKPTKPTPLTSIFNHPDRWTKRSFARDKRGNAVDPQASQAVCWCLSGALIRCKLSWWTFSVTVAEWQNIPTPLSGWNDRSRRTFAEIRALAEAIDRARGLKISPLRPLNHLPPSAPY